MNNYNHHINYNYNYNNNLNNNNFNNIYIPKKTTKQLLNEINNDMDQLSNDLNPIFLNYQIKKKIQMDNNLYNYPSYNNNYNYIGKGTGYNDDEFDEQNYEIKKLIQKANNSLLYSSNGRYNNRINNINDIYRKENGGNYNNYNNEDTNMNFNNIEDSYIRNIPLEKNINKNRIKKMDNIYETSDNYINEPMIYSQKDERFLVKQGPVFANFVLADEINRAPAKVQSALLEAMQEKQVTIGSESFNLPNPFLVMATQNPIEQEGTYPLPEAQMDRFMLKVVIGYPTIDEEKKIIRENIAGALPTVTPVTTASEIVNARAVVREVYIDEKIEQYIADIVFATRYPDRYGLKDMKEMISFGGSPRASINLAKAARAYAFIKRRGYVVPEDVRAVAHDVLRHRIGLTYEAEASNVTSEEIVSKLINKVEVT